MKNSPSTGDSDKLESTWQIENFSCDHVLIPRNIRGHSKLSSTNVEKPTMLRNERELRSGIGIVIRLGFFCYTRLIAQRDNIVAYTILQPLRGSKPQKLSNSLNSSSRSNIEWN